MLTFRAEPYMLNGFRSVWAKFPPEKQRDCFRHAQSDASEVTIVCSL